MKDLRLLQDFTLSDGGKAKAGDIVEVDDDDIQSFIDDGIAERVVFKKEDKKAKERVEDDIIAKAANIAAKQVNEELKAELKIPAQPKDDKSPWPTMGHFAKGVMTGLADDTIRNYYAGLKASGMSEGINADGGFLIPPEFSTALLNAIAQAGVIAPKCRNFPVNNNLSLPFVNKTTEATSWTGGVTIYKPAEAVAKTTSYPVLAKCELKLNKMTAVVYATDELLNDSPIALETFLSTMVSTEMALTKDEDIINGSGAGEAQGIMNSPALVSVAKESGQAAATISYTNVLKMWSRLYGPSMRNAVWLISQDSMQQIMKLSVAVGTGGAPVIVMNATTSLPQQIFGAPIIWSPHCQTLGTTGDIIVADFSQYITITKAGMGMETATSIHLKFLEDETAFRFVVRFDGQGWWSSAVTPKHGSSTVSPFVALATRE